jgi:aerobic carbon-monoxide dehydrogenase medium subunit
LKAPSFAYAKPRALAEALELISHPGAKVLAGGQSLIPSLNMRLSAPELLVDIGGLEELAHIEAGEGVLRVGALVTHARLERSPEVARHVPLLAQAVPHVAHAAIRNRGTLGGSLALADPAAEYPACVLALEAVLLIAGRKSTRRVKAEAYFKGLFETDLRPGELLTGVEFPVAAKGERCAFEELARRQGDYAIVGLAARRAATLRLAFFGVGATPVLARHAAAQKTLREASEALARDLDPAADLYHSAATKLHLARVLLERAWNAISRSH